MAETYQEWKKRKYGIEPSPSSTNTSSSGSTKTTGNESYEEWKKRKAEEGTLYSDQQRAEARKFQTSWGLMQRNYNQYITQANDFFQNASKEYISGGKNDTAERLRSQGRDLLKWFDQYGSYLDADAYRNIVGDLQELDSDYGDLMDFYSQFETQDAYDMWDAYSTPEKRQARYEQNQTRLEELKKQRLEMTGLMSWGTVRQDTSDIDAEIAAIEREMQMYERGGTDADTGFYYGSKVVDDYSGYLNDPNYGQFSAEDFQNPTKDDLRYYDAMMDQSTWYQDNSGNTRNRMGDIVTEYVNADDPRYQIADPLGVYLQANPEDISNMHGDGSTQLGVLNQLLMDGYYGSWDQLDEREREIYYTLLGTQGKEAAMKYLSDMETELNRRNMAQESELYKLAFERANGWQRLGMSAVSIPANLLGGATAFVDDLSHTVRGEDINPYSAAHQMQNYGQQVRANQAAAFDESSGWEIPGIGFSAGDLYQAAMSTADMFGGAMIGPTAYGALMGMGAASSEARRLYEMGASKDQIFWGSAAAGAAELVFEKFSIEKLIDIKDADTLGKLVLNALKQGGIEASEEGATELANLITNNLIMTSESDWAKLVESNNGNKWAAAMAAAGQIGEAAAGGFVSGLIGGAGSATMNYAQNYRNDMDQGKAILEADALQPLRDLAMEMAARKTDKAQADLQKQSDQFGKEFVYNFNRDRAAGRLYRAVQNTVAESNKEDVANALQKQGYSQKEARKIADAFYTQAVGLEVSKAQQKVIQEFGKNEDVQKIIGDLLLSSESTIAKRNQNLQNFRPDVIENQLVKKLEEATGEKIDLEEMDNAEEIDDSAPSLAVSEDGSTRIISTGKPVNITGFAKSKDGKAMLRTDTGELVAADDVSYANDSDALIYETIANLGAPVSNANGLLSAYKGKSTDDAEIFARGIQEAFEYGRMGIPMAEMKDSAFASKLSKFQMEYAYKQGKKAEGKRIAREKSAIRKKDKRSSGEKRTGTVHFDGNGRNFSNVQETSLKTLDKLAAMLGMDFYVYESYEDASGNRVYLDDQGNEVVAPNGYYDSSDGSVHIDLNAGNDGKGIILFTASHELVHFIRQWSPAKFKVLANFLVEQYHKEGVSVNDLIHQQMENAKQDGREITFEEAYEEMVADSMETMLADGNVVQMMAELKQRDRTLWQKICDWFRDLVADLQQMVDSYKGVKPETAEGRMVADMKDAINVFQALYTDALYDASESFQTAKNTTGDGGVKYSFRGYAEDGTGIYESNFPIGTPKKAKGERILRYIQDVWSKKPITLRIEDENGVRYIEAKFDPTFSEDENIRTDASKLMGGNRHGTSKEQRVTLDLADDYYQIASESRYNYSKDEVGKTSDPHLDVKKWHYFINDIYFAEQGSDNLEPYRVSINVKEKDSGHFFYSFSAEKTKGTSTLRTLHAAVNSTENDTANGSSFISSIRNDNGKVNKKLSARNKSAKDVNAAIQKENAQLKEDIQQLKELLKLQRTVTGGTKFTKSSVESMAGILMQNNNAKGDRKELARMLNDLYEYIATSKELSWEAVAEQAQPAVDWIRRNVVVKKELSQYAKDILHTLRTSRISLNENQKGEAAYRYGSVNDYRKSMMGSVVIANDGVPLDVQWQEWASTYPDIFDADISDSDMPGALADVISSLRNSDLSVAEYAYHADMIEQDILRQVYDSYWRVSTLRTVADVKQREINLLKGKHYQKMNELRQKHQEASEKMKQAQRDRIKKLRQEYRDSADKKIQAIKDKNEASRKRVVESREKTAMRHKIQNVVAELNRLLLSNDKKAHVPDSLKKAVADALDLVNMDTVDAEARAAKYASLIEKETDPDKIAAYTVTMENILRQGEKVGQRLNELRSAYEDIQKSTDPDIVNAYDPVIAGNLKELAESIGNTSIKNMTLEQLSDVYDMYRMVLTRVRDANKALMENMRASIGAMADDVVSEVKRVGGEKKYRVSALDPVSQFLWNNLKPVYAMETIGSSTLSKVFENVRAGEDTWAVDVTDARKFFLANSKKYGFNKWDFKKKYSFESASGISFELTLDQILSLYAYSKREQAHDHLRLGGFVFDSNIETTKEKDGKNSILKYKVNTADAHQITPDILADITGNLSAEQKQFVDAMQSYLSDVMGAKGNEVTMKMYGVKLFKEQNYFPLKSAKQFMFEQNEVAGEVRIKNSGFTNKVVAKANNPVILSNFMDVWSDHVDAMSMYHAFTLPLEDFNRVFNYNTPKAEGQGSVSVKGTIQNAYGPAAVSYVKQLITDLNGGARSDSTTGPINKLMGMYKKGAVFASLSVVVQQPSAIARAAALIDTKYFIGRKVDPQRHKMLWNEVKKYAPIAIIKEMGYFDTNVGKSTRDFIQGKEYDTVADKMKALVTDSDYRDEVLSKAPALADELAWCGIWEAVKRETKAKHPKMDVGTEEFLKLCGARFTEVITKTQVYDSVLSRSANMRSTDTGMKMATAFMAEPTTSINMIADALIKGKRGNVKYARTAIGAVIASQILNSILVAFVYAGRDDDEDESYWEKYVEHLTANMVDSLNPIGYIPFLRDVLSIAQGYYVERSDMAVISDLWKAWKNLQNDKVSPYMKFEGFVGSVAQLFGLPAKNILRDGRGVYNTIVSFVDGRYSTKAGFGYAFKSGLPKWMGGGAVSNQNQLYNAYLNEDAKHIARVEDRYKEESDAHNALRKGLRENDPRIREAAEYLNSDDYSSYLDIVEEIMDEGHFDRDDVIKAIRSEASALAPEEGTGVSKAQSLMTAEQFAIAVANGDTDVAEIAMEDIIATAQENGKTESEAVDSFHSSAKNALKDQYLVDILSGTDAEKALVAYCGMDAEEAAAAVRKWEFESKSGFAYGDMRQEFLAGNITAAEAEKYLQTYGGKTADEAAETIKEWEFEKKNGYVYSDRKNAFLEGKVSASALRRHMMEYDGMSAAEADNTIRAYEWMKRHPQYDMSVDDVIAYTKPIEKLGYSIESYSIKPEVFIRYKDLARNATGVDSDGDGKVDTGSKKAEILEIINVLPLTAKQKDALYYLNGWAASNLRKAPWH